MRSDPTPREALAAAWKAAEEAGEPPVWTAFQAMSVMLSYRPQTLTTEGNSPSGPATIGAANEVTPATLERPGVVASPTKEDQQ